MSFDAAVSLTRSLARHINLIRLSSYDRLQNDPFCVELDAKRRHSNDISPSQSRTCFQLSLEILCVLQGQP